MTVISNMLNISIYTSKIKPFFRIHLKHTVQVFVIKNLGKGFGSLGGYLLSLAYLSFDYQVRVLSHLETVCELVSSERRDVCKAVVDGLTQEVLYHLLTSMVSKASSLDVLSCPCELTPGYSAKFHLNIG